MTIDASSITTLHAQRDGDLRSARFLDVTNHPVISYRSTAIAPVLPGRWLVEGELTIRGLCRPTSLDVTLGGTVLDAAVRPRVAFHADATLTRSEFGLTTELEKEAGTTLVAHDLTIDIDVEAVRAVAE